jgi:hypothetical protein
LLKNTNMRKSRGTLSRLLSSRPASSWSICHPVALSGCPGRGPKHLGFMLTA